MRLQMSMKKDYGPLNTEGRNVNLILYTMETQKFWAGKWHDLSVWHKNSCALKEEWRNCAVHIQWTRAVCIYMYTSMDEPHKHKADQESKSQKNKYSMTPFI